MLRTLHLFNPWHDEALAVHRPHHIPTLASRRLAAALGDLPRWWMPPEDVCLVFPPSMLPEDATPPDWDTVGRIEPWGWDICLVQMLRRIGAPDRLLPTVGQLDRLRALSSRKTGVGLLEWLNGQRLPPGVLPGESRWCTSWSEVAEVLAQHPDGAMLKQPWSSSGRGVFSNRGGQNAVAEARARRCLHRQGGIEVQRWYRREADGALEFGSCESGRVEFVGCSLFSTAENGAYAGHLVDKADALKMRFLQTWRQTSADALPASVLERSLNDLIALLSEGLQRLIGGAYVGDLGVDVLFTPEGLHPCIEINLRRTMGHVALRMGERLPESDLPAVLTVGLEGCMLKPLS